MNRDITILYSPSLKVVADAACAGFESSGLRCWIAPRDFPHGMDSPEIMGEAVQASRLVVPVFSSTPGDSAAFRPQIQQAVSLGLPVFPLRVDDAALHRGFDPATGRRLDGITPAVEAQLREVLRACQSFLLRATPGVVYSEQAAAPVLPSPPLPAQQAPAPLVIKVPPAAEPQQQPYQTAPSQAAQVVVPQASPPVVPNWLRMSRAQALEHIRNAWITGGVSALVTIAVVLASVSGRTVAPGLKLDWTGLLDVFIMLGLSFGVYRRIRWCAFGLLGYFILNKVIMWGAGVGGTDPTSLLLSFAFLYFFYQGVRGTWAYHLMKDVWDRPAVPPNAYPSHF